MDDIHVSNKMAVRLLDPDIDSMCKQHVCHPETFSEFDAINSATANFIRAISSNCPPCADTQIALRCIREARMWANSAIALDPKNWADKRSITPT